MILIFAYVAMVIGVLGSWVLVSRERRTALREDVEAATLAIYSVGLWLMAWPRELVRAYRYKPTHATYRPDTRAWSFTL